MNLLAFLWLVGCVTVVILAVVFHDEVVPIFKAIEWRIRNPRPPRPSTLEELHRHWEATDRARTWPWPSKPEQGGDNDG